MRKSILFLSVLMFCTAAIAAPKAERWTRWEKHDAAATTTVRHDALTAFLDKYRSTQNGVALLDYGGVSESDAEQLRAYIAQLSKTAVDTLNRDEQRAFWINAYNALTIELILANYPVESIRDISPSFLSFGPWDEKMFPIGGEELSLNDIEHRILRPIWKDARLHYAVNCASIGCPNIASVAFTAANSEALLESGARTYVNHPRGAAVENGQLRVSSIYEWFKDDFGGSDAGVIQHLKQYAATPLQDALTDISAIAEDGYDWSLNKQ